MKETTKEVAKKQTAAVAIPEELQGGWGTQEATQEDVTIPKILLMHGQSEFVLEGKAQVGDLVRSTTLEKLSGLQTTVKIVPFMFEKVWAETKYDVKSGNYEWQYNHPWTAENTNLEWEYTDAEGQKWRRNKTYAFAVMLVDDVKNDALPLPAFLRFTRTSFKAGQAIADHFFKKGAENMPGCTHIWELGSKLIKKDHNFYVFTTEKGRETSIDEMLICKKWYDLLQADAKKETSRFKEHNIDEGGTVISDEDAEF
jgi:hypothetical protein